jgi:hypothetical protein
MHDCFNSWTCQDYLTMDCSVESYEDYLTTDCTEDTGNARIVSIPGQIREFIP